MSALASACTLIVSVRCACELGLRPVVRDLQTPSRVASLVHGVLSCLQLWEGNWAEAISSAGTFFALDLLMTLWIQRSMHFEMVLHHVLGGALCFYSVLTDSAMTENVGRDLTRALILVELTNPLLHVLAVFRREHLDARIPKWMCQVFQGLFLVQFFILRVVQLARVLFDMSFIYDKTNEWEKSMFWISSSLWCLQVLWFFKLMRIALKMN